MSKFLTEPSDDAVAPIMKWIKGKGGLIIYSTGDRFSSEVSEISKRKLSSFVQAGLARLVSASKFKGDKVSLQKSGNLKSDDAHVLALARYSGARLLYSKDKNLLDDFRNKKIIDNPRGKIYSDQRQSNLLTKNACRARGS